MSTVASDKGGGDYQIMESGTYAGRCYGVIDIGVQKGEYQGNETFKHQIILLFETPNELMQDGRPFGLSAFFTLSLHENSALRPALEAWRGKPFTEEERAAFDVAVLLGHACMLTVTVTEKGKNKIASIGKPMKGMTIPQAVNPLVHFDLDKYLDGSTIEAEVYDRLPDWIKKKIQGSEDISHPKEREYLKKQKEKELEDDADIPF